MPLQLFVPPQSGQLLGQGIASAGQSIADGIRQYSQNKLMSGQAIGKFEAAAKANPDIMQFLQGPGAPPELAKAFMKLGKEGSVPLKDAALLAQFADTYQGQKQQQQQTQMGAIQLQQAQRQQSFLAQMMAGGGGGQPQQGGAPQGMGQFMPQGQSAAQAQGQAPAPPGISDAVQGFVRSYAQGTGMMPPPEAIEKFVAVQLGRETPVGVVMGTAKADKDGNPIAQTWNRVYRKGDGSVRVDNSPIETVYGAPPPGQLLDSTAFQPISPQTIGQPIKQGDMPSAMTPERQQAIKDATEHLNLLALNEQKINKLGDAVQAYIKANPGGLRTNPVMGTGPGLAFRQMVFGDTTGPTLNQGISNNLNTIMDNMREGSKNGSLGMRLTQNEWNQLKEAFPKTTDAPDVMLKGFQNIAATNQYTKAYAQEYLKNLRTMTPGDAAEAANKAVSMPAVQQIRPQSNLPVVANKSQYDALKSGEQFTTPSGQVRMKP